MYIYVYIYVYIYIYIYIYVYIYMYICYQTGSGLSLSTPPPALLAALTHRVFSSNDLSSSGPAKLWLKPSPPTALPEPIPWLRRGNGHWYHPGWMG